MALKQKNEFELLKYSSISKSVISLGEQEIKKKRKKIEKKWQKFFILPTFFQGTELKPDPSHFS